MEEQTQLDHGLIIALYAGMQTSSRVHFYILISNNDSPVLLWWCRMPTAPQPRPEVLPLLLPAYSFGRAGNSIYEGNSSADSVQEGTRRILLLTTCKNIRGEKPFPIWMVSSIRFKTNHDDARLLPPESAAAYSTRIHSRCSLTEPQETIEIEERNRCIDFVFPYSNRILMTKASCSPPEHL